VGGVQGITEGELTTFFNEILVKAVGPSPDGGQHVLSVYVNQERAFAFVELKGIELTTACMALDGIRYQDHQLRIRRPSDYNAATAPQPTGPIPTLNLAALGIVSTTVSDGPNKVFIGGIPYHLSEEQVRELLTAFGPLKAFHLVREVGSATSKGYAFCEYLDPAITVKACEGLDGLQLGEKSLTVRVATTKGTSEPPPAATTASVQEQLAVAMLAGVTKANAAAAAAASMSAQDHEMEEEASSPAPAPAPAPAAAPPLATAAASGDVDMDTSLTPAPAPAPVLPSLGVAASAPAAAAAAAGAVVPGHLHLPPAAAVPVVAAAAAVPVQPVQSVVVPPAAMPAAAPPAQPVEVSPEAQEALAAFQALEPTNVLVLMNMVGTDELSNEQELEEIIEDIWQETEKHGEVQNVMVPKPAGAFAASSVGKAFVHFAEPGAAQSAGRTMAGRTFNERIVRVEFYDESAFLAGDLH